MQRFYFDTSVFGGVFDIGFDDRTLQFFSRMKTETKKAIKRKEFDTIKTFRAIKDKISLDMVNMNFEQIKEYLKTNSAKLYTK
ncbi:hypothetical protein BH11BAC3_BH11BAC3_39460 [soil metagenome]